MTGRGQNEIFFLVPRWNTGEGDKFRTRTTNVQHNKFLLHRSNKSVRREKERRKIGSQSFSEIKFKISESFLN